MDNPQDCLVTSSQDVIKNNCPSTSGHHSVSVYQNRNVRKKKIKGGTDQFLWFVGFQKLSRSVLGNNSMKELLNVINVYTEHVSSDVSTCYSKPNRAAKLKTNMISTLGVFHNCYITMKEPFDEATYLEKISNLLTMYFDMEVKASRRGKESMKKITSKLISALFIFLNNSSEYILDTLLKARFTVKSYSEICIPIFKMVTNLPQSQEMNYVRSLLLFKLWKRMLPCREERNSINRLAVAKLSPPPAQVMEFIKRGLLASVLPTPPEDKKAALLTRFYMTKKFNLRESIKAFLKLEADLKLNDFTSVLDSIRFLDDDEDVVPVENSFEKDYTLLESIWLDISNSPESPDSSPSTSGCSPLDVGCSKASRMLELSKTPPRKAKKSLFKPKSPKKNKSPKTKSKEKNKKKEVELIIDLCKENEDDCILSKQVLENTKSKSKAAFESQVCDQVPSPSTAIGTSVKSSKTFLSENSPEVNCSNDLKLSHNVFEKNSKLTKVFEESKVELETKLNVKNHLKSEASSSKSLGEISKPQFGDIISSPTTFNDFSTNTLLEATIAPQSIAEVEQNDYLKSKCKLFDKTQEKTTLDQESKVKPETSNDFTEAEKNEIKVLPQASDVKKMESVKESNLETASMEVTEEVSPTNKIVITCKNFSKIGFKHEEEEEKEGENAAQKCDEPEELISTVIEFSEDPILKIESLKEDSQFFKDDSPERLVDQIEHGLDVEEEISWDQRLKGTTPEINLPNPKITHSTVEEGLTNLNCNKDFSNSRFDLDSTTRHSPKNNSFEDFFLNERTSLSKNEQNKLSEEESFRLNTAFRRSLKSDNFNNLFPDDEINSGKKEPNKRFGEPAAPVLSESPSFSENSLSNRFAGQVNHIQSFLEAKISKHVSNALVNTCESSCQNVKDIVNPSPTVSPKAHPSITEMVDMKSGKKIIHKSISTIINELKEGDSSVSSDNSNQESSEVSSSSFEDTYPIKMYTTPVIKMNTPQESMPCKIEKEHFKEFSACMQNSQPTLVKAQLSEKCDKNIQVPSEKTSFIVKESNFNVSSKSASLPKNNSVNPQAFKLHKGLNTCLLHKILGEEDCLKSGCLLKSSVTGKNLQGPKERGYPDVSLKQELENSSELPPENSTPTISPLWNPVAGIKVENESSRSSECAEGIRKTSSEFLIMSVTEACNFKDLDYNIENECDNLMSNYDCESDCEDRNLVIDEDIDSIKDQTETEDIQLNHGTDRVQDVANNSTVSPFILTENKHSKKVDQQLWDNSVTHEIPNLQHQEHQSSNKVQTMENASMAKELAGKHKLPRIVESNVKTSTFRNSYVNETVNSNVKFRPRTSQEELFLVESGLSYTAAQHYRGEIKSGVPKQYTQPKTTKMPDGSPNTGQISPNQRLYSPYSIPHGSNPKIIRTKNRDPRLGPVCTDNSYHLKPNVNVQSNLNTLSSQIKPLENISSVNQPVLASNMAKAASPRPVPSPSHFETYTKYNVCNNMSIPINQSNSSQAERYGQKNLIGNENYRTLEKVCQKRESPIGKCHENPINTHTNLRAYAEVGNLKDNSNQSFHKQSGVEPQTMRAGESLYDINTMRDPLCLVKNKEDLREIYDFAIAQEIEIGSENFGGEWQYTVTDPNYPIANEQNVTDSSSYTQTPEQHMYSLLKSDEASMIAEAEQSCHVYCELQQIDTRRPGNISGKNINQEQLNLHLRTLDGDYSYWGSQTEFKQFYLSQDLPPTIPVPLLWSQTDNTMRCPCEQCSDNHQKLLSNYDTLRQFRNSKIKPQVGVFLKPDDGCYAEKDLNGEFDSSLPLKKRRTNSQINKLTSSKANDDLVLPSYPNTPMISIAQLELTGYEQGNQVIVPNPQSQWRESVAYNPLNLVQPPAMEQFDVQGKGKRRASKRRKSCR